MKPLKENNRSSVSVIRRRFVWLLAPGLVLIALSGLSLWNWHGMLTGAMDGLDGWFAGMIGGSATGVPSSNVAQPPARFVPLEESPLQVLAREPNASAENPPGPVDELGERIATKTGESSPSSLLAAAAAAAAGDDAEAPQILCRVVLAGVALEGVKEGENYQLRAGHLQRTILMPDGAGQFELAGSLEDTEPGERDAAAGYCGSLQLDAASEMLNVSWRESAGAAMVAPRETTSGMELTADFLQGNWKDVQAGGVVEFGPGGAVEEQLGRFLAGEVGLVVRAQLSGVAGVNVERLRVELVGVPRSRLKIDGKELRWVLRSPLTLNVNVQPRVSIL